MNVNPRTIPIRQNGPNVGFLLMFMFQNLPSIAPNTRAVIARMMRFSISSPLRLAITSAPIVKYSG